MQIPQENHVKYLGLHLDRRLTLRKQLGNRNRMKNSGLCLYVKLELSLISLKIGENVFVEVWLADNCYG
jgi:hypothetical protein